MSKHLFTTGLFMAGLSVTCLFTGSLLISETAVADVPADQRVEVTHLMRYIKNSGCIINRNGTDYSAEKAISHIEKKYDYFRDDIKSTEAFIEYAATKSTMSGKYYMVTCPDMAAIPAKDWLLAELKTIRTNNQSK